MKKWKTFEKEFKIFVFLSLLMFVSIMFFNYKWVLNFLFGLILGIINLSVSVLYFNIILTKNKRFIKKNYFIILIFSIKYIIMGSAIYFYVLIKKANIIATFLGLLLVYFSIIITKTIGLRKDEQDGRGETSV